ncbi:MAG: hypothetical protein OFPI_33410 [Osedax symbiont Rs2]|nr:MAG: hypothetical protein OFPI_33410 [Osedax symbiont Rs2]
MNLLAQLHLDHVNISKLLLLLDQNLQQIRQGEIPELKLMAEAVEYIGHYADLYPHPLEEQMMEYFMERSEPLKKHQFICHKQHRELDQKSQQVLAPIAMTLLDGMLPMEQVLRALDDFLKAQKAHLDYEEREIFPLIKTLANEQDWQTLAKRSKLTNEKDKYQLSQFSAIYAELGGV